MTQKHYTKIISIIILIVILSVATLNVFFTSSIFTGKQTTATGMVVTDLNPDVEMVIPDLDLVDQYGYATGHQELTERQDSKFDMALSSSPGIPNLVHVGELPEASVYVYGYDSENESVEVNSIIDTLDEDDERFGVIKTSLFAIDSIAIDNATITLPKTHKVDYILRCDEFDQENFECIDLHGWQETNTNFIDNGDTITFTVAHFTAYAGGGSNESDSANMTIWDNADEGMFHGDEEMYVLDEVEFFANYSMLNGSTIGAETDGDGVTCIINFSNGDSGVMNYIGAYDLYEYDNTFEIAGDYDYNVSCDNLLGYVPLNTTDNITILGYGTPPEGAAACVVPSDNLNLTSHTTFCNGTYYVDDQSDLGAITIKASNINITCNNTLIYGDGTDYLFWIEEYDNVVIKGCNISLYDTGITMRSDSASNIIEDNYFSICDNDGVEFGATNFTIVRNNTFDRGTNGIDMGTSAYNNTIINNTLTSHGSRGIDISGDHNNITNNTLYNQSTSAITADGSAENNKIWLNKFYDERGLDDNGVNTDLCVNDLYGNYFNGSVGAAYIPINDCGPTPNATILLYDNSEVYNWTWGSTGNATYNNLREAVYNVESGDTINGALYSGVFYENDTDTAKSNITLDCNGVVFDDRASGDEAINFISAGDWWTIQNCTFTRYNNVIDLNSGSNNNTFRNNTFSSCTNIGMIISSDHNNITNNTFYNISFEGISEDSNGDNNNIWGNKFLGESNCGFTSTSTNTNLCLDNLYGNYYDENVNYQDVPANDCGPTPNATILLYDKSAKYNWTWGGATTTYNNLREAVYNTESEDAINGTTYSGAFYENTTDSVRNNITLNCNGVSFNNRAKSGQTIILRADSGWTIKNCTFIAYTGAIELNAGADNTTIINNTFLNDKDRGIDIDTDHNNITNNTFYNSTSEGIMITGTASNINVWGNRFFGISNDGIVDSGTGTDLCFEGLYGNYYNGTVDTGGLDVDDCGPSPNATITVDINGTFNLTWRGNVTVQNFQEGIYNTYNDSSGALLDVKPGSGPYEETVTTLRNNIVINCSGTTLLGSGTGNGISINGERDITIRNCTLDNFDDGIELDNANYNKIYNSTFTNNDMKGVLFDTASDFNEVKHCNFTSNDDYGIYGAGTTSDSNNITENTFDSNADYAIYLDTEMDNTNVWRNNFRSNNAAGSQQVYNDDTTNNFNISDTGNYWDDFDEAAEDCNDAGGDGFCDLQQDNITQSGGMPALVNDSFAYVAFIDYMAEAIPSSIITIGACGNLSDKGEYELNQSMNSSGTCIDIETSNITLDCKGYTINYSQGGIRSNVGINVSSAENFVKNLTIKNCNIVEGNDTQSWKYGIGATNVSNSTIENNNITTIGGYSRGIDLTGALTDGGIIIANNTISTYNEYGHGIDWYRGYNYTLINNTITVRGSNADGLSVTAVSKLNLTYNNFSTEGRGTTIEFSNTVFFDHSIDATNTEQNKPIYYNISISNSKMINPEEIGFLFIANSENITISGANLTSCGIELYNVNNSNITNSTIKVNDTGLDIWNSFNNNISYNQFSTYSAQYSRNIYLESGENNLIDNNTMGGGIPIRISGMNNNITRNYIYGLGLSDDGIRAYSNTNGSVIKDNNISITGSGDFGVAISSTSDLTITNNTIIGSGGIEILSSKNIIMKNNKVHSTQSFIVDSSVQSMLNTIIYNNTYGMINWNLGSLNTSYNMSINETIFLINNTVGLLDETFDKLNGSAQIEIRNLGYASTPFLLKDGTRCDNDDICNISYSEGILYANISSFSNYTTTTDLSKECGVITTDLNLTQSVNSSATCYTINASDITINCMGYAVNYSEISSGHGFYTQEGFNNITIKNCSIYGASSVASEGVYFNGTINATLRDSNISSLGGASRGVLLGFASQSNILNNTINISGAGAVGILIAASNDSIIENNTILINESGSKGIKIQSLSNNNTLINNNLTVETITVIDDDGSAVINNTLKYNNSFGEITWINANLTTSINLTVGENIFLEDNNIGLIDNTNILQLNSSAQIEIRNLVYTATPSLLKDGTRCDNGDNCNISYDSTNGILDANISSFSNYSVNMPPNITLSLKPTTATALDILNATTNYTDDDGNIGTVYFDWWVDGSSVSTGAPGGINSNQNVSDLLSPGSYLKWQNVTVQAVPNDGSENGTALNYSINISNIAPDTDIDQITLTPSPIYTNDTLNATAIFLDGDTGDVGTLYFDLFVNNAWQFVLSQGSIAGNANASSTFNSGNFSRWQNVTIQVTPNDGVVNGTAVNISTNVTNIVPEQIGLALSPDTIYTNSTKLNATVVVWDDDQSEGTTLTAYFDWFINGTNQYANFTEGLTNGSNVSAYLNPTNFSKWDNVTAQIVVYDGFENSTVVNSSWLNVTNIAPYINVTDIYSPGNCSTAQINASGIIRDEDFESQTVYFDWFVENTNAAGINYSETISSVTVGDNTSRNLTTGNFTLDDNVTLQIVTNDGVSNSTPINTSTITILNCTTPEAAPDPTPDPVPGGGGGEEEGEEEEEEPLPPPVCESSSSCSRWDDCERGEKTRTCTRTSSDCSTTNYDETESCCSTDDDCSRGYTCINSECELTPWCIDSDGGKEIYTKGTITSNFNTAFEVGKEDECYDFGTKIRLIEYTCKEVDNYPIYNYVDCTYGCRDGKCLECSSEIECGSWGSCEQTTEVNERTRERTEVYKKSRTCVDVNGCSEEYIDTADCCPEGIIGRAFGSCELTCTAEEECNWGNCENGMAYETCTRTDENCEVTIEVINREQCDIEELEEEEVLEEIEETIMTVNANKEEYKISEEHVKELINNAIEYTKQEIYKEKGYYPTDLTASINEESKEVQEHTTRTIRKLVQNNINNSKITDYVEKLKEDTQTGQLLSLRYGRIISTISVVDLNTSITKTINAVTFVIKGENDESKEIRNLRAIESAPEEIVQSEENIVYLGQDGRIIDQTNNYLIEWKGDTLRSREQTEISYMLNSMKDTIGLAFMVSGEYVNKLDRNIMPCTSVSYSENNLPISTIKTEVKNLKKQLTKDEEVIIPAFSLKCNQENLDMTLNIPEEYGEIRILKCEDGDCSKVNNKIVDDLNCGQEIINEKIIEDDYSHLTSIETKEVELNVEEFKLALTGMGTEVLKIRDETKKELGISINEQALQPSNPRLKIIGKPVKIKAKNIEKELEINLPYIIPEGFENESIGIYVNKGKNTDNKIEWVYLGGEINKKEKTISIKIDDINEVVDSSDNNFDLKTITEEEEIEVALMGILCLNCLRAELELAYEPELEEEIVKDAIIFVHGLASSPGTYEKIIKDIKLTDQAFQSWTFSYPTTDSIEKNAKEFARLLELNSNKFDRLFIAGHSLGGIITQQAAHYAYEENKKVEGTFSFVNKIKRIVLIGTPNEGTPLGPYKGLFQRIINLKVEDEMFNVEGDIVDQVSKGIITERVPGIKYYVIAGDLPYAFSSVFFEQQIGKETIMEPNDGLVSVKSAQNVGGEYVNESCIDFWKLKLTHTELLKNPIGRKLIEKVISEEVTDDDKIKSTMGKSQFYQFHISECSEEDKYVVLGKKLDEREILDPTGCKCGDGYCAAFEDYEDCPEDCPKVRKTRIFGKGTLFGLLIIMLLGGIAVIGAVGYLPYRAYMHYIGKEISKVELNVAEKMHLEKYISEVSKKHGSQHVKNSLLKRGWNKQTIETYIKKHEQQILGKLKSYSDGFVKKGIHPLKLREHLIKKGWHQSHVDKVLGISPIALMRQLREHVKHRLKKGHSKIKIREDLISRGWHYAHVDKLLNIEPALLVNEMKKYVLGRLKQGHAKLQILESLVKKGWPQHYAEILLGINNKTATDELGRYIYKRLEKGDNSIEIRNDLLEKGWQKELVDKYLGIGKEDGIKLLKRHIDSELAQGRKIDEIKIALISKGWSKKVVNKYLELEKKVKINLLKDYIKYELFQGSKPIEVREKLLRKHWDKEVVDKLLGITHAIALKALVEHIKLANKSKISKLEYREKLLKQGWDKEIIDYLLNIKDVDSAILIKEYAKKQLKKGASLKQVRKALLKRGWPQKYVDKVLGITKLVGLKLLGDHIHHAIKHNYNEKEIRKNLEKAGWDKKVVHDVIKKVKTKYIRSKMLPAIKYIHGHMKAGKDHRKIKQTLVKAGWDKNLVDKAVKACHHIHQKEHVNKLTSYIKNQLKKGTKESKIKQALRKKGWSESKLKHILASIHAKKPQKDQHKRK
ncbi:hypothetical protein HN695_04395 [Candidatus Woesearchaeota archaeon]|nr:hypothetical protein [Candidatus Woesearchaeota archaeon]MBT5272390.1 hypothetical protein [Candidatus Woesearchaeota archaeon]MBT6336662.1 hypothetical protein [Candidatus Woesearchaeota archaeon]MBT7927552.1 hypothetical protein [Candidatus Woesearchaeota archaeon]